MNSRYLYLNSFLFLSLIYQLAMPTAFAQVPNAIVSGQGLHPAPEIAGDASHLHPQCQVN